jgi:hypothetical protein
MTGWRDPYRWRKHLAQANIRFDPQDACRSR